MEKEKIATPVVNPQEQYLLDLIPDKDPLIREIAYLTNHHGRPFLGPQGGMLLAILAMMKKALRVYEWTGAYGYSTLWLTKVLPQDSHYVIGTIADENQRLISNYLKRAGLQSRARIEITDGPSHFSKIEGKFDLVVLDLQQERSKLSNWLDVLPEKVSPGGIVFSLGNLPAGIGTSQSKNLTLSAVEMYNHRMFNDPRFVSSLLPVSEGILVSWRTDQAD
jgi:caffeoyl-CoA O-methyltransferase|uniref:Methyltransferase n=1 Tax=Leptospirillum ferriphilum TaxID=178606 RepID=A0A7C3LUQ0_9BACT